MSNLSRASANAECIRPATIGSGSGLLKLTPSTSKKLVAGVSGVSRGGVEVGGIELLGRV